MKSFVTAAILLASAQSVLGHAVWQEFWVGDVDQAGTCVRMPPSNSPVTDVTSSDITCGAGGTKGVPGICAVNAGEKVTVEMHQHESRACTEEAIGGAHHGPVIIYMAAVTDATTADPTTAKWFKVAEEGYDAATKTWADDTLNANCGKKEFTVPSDIATGDYLIRAEEIALHAAGSAGGAQFYTSCFQVHVAGSGTVVPGGVSFPGAYKATDAGILINIYAAIDDYIIPGPELYSGATSGSTPAVSSAAAAPAASSTSIAVTTSVPVSEATPTVAPVSTSAAAPVESSGAAPVQSSVQALPSTTAIASSPVETSAPVATSVPADEESDDEYEDCE